MKDFLEGVFGGEVGDKRFDFEKGLRETVAPSLFEFASEGNWVCMDTSFCFKWHNNMVSRI